MVFIIKGPTIPGLVGDVSDLIGIVSAYETPKIVRNKMEVLKVTCIKTIANAKTNKQFAVLK